MDIHFHHICIETDDYAASMEFYCSIFGFVVIEENKDFHGRAYNTWLKKNDIIIELQTPKKKSDHTTVQSGYGLKHICFTVDDLQSVVRALEKKSNVKFYKERKIYEVMGGQLCKIVSPDHVIIELREPVA